MTMKEAYQQGECVLRRAKIAEAHLDAWYLLEYVTQVSRTAYYALPDKPLTEKEEKLYAEYIERRASHIPLQHLTGVQEFMGLEFQVNKHVLIPRQDTEVLAEEALAVLKEQAETHEGESIPYRILDMCTGSGCILLSLLYYAGKYRIRKTSGTGADISRDALNIAEANAESLHLRAEFLCSDLFEQVEGKYQMIVSNPPYIQTAAIDTLQEEVRIHDPLIALDGKEDGLYFYRKIVREAEGYLTEGGCLLFEIGCDQGEAVQLMMKQAGYSRVTVKKDLAGLDRVVTGVYDKQNKSDICEGKKG